MRPTGRPDPRLKSTFRASQQRRCQMRTAMAEHRRVPLWNTIVVTGLLSLSAALSAGVAFAQPALAAQAQVPGSSLSQAAVPAAMPLISRNVPAYTNDNCGGATSAAWANDAIYDYGWRSCATPSTSAPTYLAYDLSSVALAQRGRVLVAWYNDPATLVYDYTYHGVHPYCCWNPYDIPADYTLEANAAP